MKNELNRRRFLRYASAAGAGLATGIPGIGHTSGYTQAKITIPGNTKFSSDKPWNLHDLRHAAHAHVAREKSCSELDVYYYRIGYTIAFQLPVAARPRHQNLPAGIAGGTYPWLTWLSMKPGSFVDLLSLVGYQTAAELIH